MHLHKMRSFFIINMPVWLIFGLIIMAAATGLNFYLSASIWLKTVVLVIMWQLLCAGVMLLLDYPRKYLLFERLTRRIADSKNCANRILKPVKQTICGLFLAWAVQLDQKNRLDISN